MQNIVTYKLKYTCDNKDIILRYIKNYNNVLKFTYNRLYDKYSQNLTTKEITKLQHNMNNVFVDSHFKNTAIYDAKALITRFENKKVCFGKPLYLKYQHGLICKEELQINRLVPLNSIGEACKKGNRKFNILDEITILFQPCKQEHVKLHLTKYKNYTNH